MNFIRLMKAGINFRVGWEAILRNKFRSLLTMLGIILGIFIVVTTVSLGGSIKSFMVSEFQNFSGTTMIFVGKRDRIKKQSKWVENPLKENLWLNDVADIVDKCPSITNATGWNMVGQQSVTFAEKNRTYMVSGAMIATKDIWGWEIEYGRNFQPWEIEQSQRVCLIGDKVRTQLFGSINPVGQEIQVLGQRFTVIGSIKKKETGLFRMLQIPLDEQVNIPVTTMARFGGRNTMRWLFIMATAETYEAVNQGKSEMQALFRQKFGSEKYHNFGSPADMIKEVSKMTTIIQWVMGGAAAITLIVGGIGTMNIMLVSVSERTGEIGLRKAIGAKSNDIRFQFLIESIFICLVGGLIGTALAGGITATVGWAITTFFIKDSVWPAAVSFEAAVVAFSVCTIVGVISGFYPSNKAASLQPVEALRTD